MVYEILAVEGKPENVSRVWVQHLCGRKEGPLKVVGSTSYDLVLRDHG